MVLGGTAGDAHDGTAGVHIPVRCTQTGKGGHDVNAAVIRYLLGVVFCVTAFLDHAQAVAHPLDHSTAHKDAALQRILHPAVQADGNGRDQAVPAAADGIAGVHQQKATGAVGVLGLALAKAALSEQRSLLVTGNAGHRDLHTAQVGGAVDLAGIGHAGQNAARNIQRFEQGVVPVQRADVIQHGAAGVGAVGDVHSAAGQLPDQPCVHSAEQDLSCLGPLPCTGHIVQDPLDLRCGEIGIGHQTGVLPDVVCHAGLLLQFIYQRCRASALPDDGVVDRAAGGLFPQDGGLPLVGDANGGDVVDIDAALGHHFVHDPILGGPDLHGVVLHPALLRIDLLKLALLHCNDVLLIVEQDGTATGGSLIQRQNIFCTHAFATSVSFRECVSQISRRHNIHAGAAHVSQHHLPGADRCVQGNTVQRSHDLGHLFFGHSLRSLYRAARIQTALHPHGAGDDAGGVGQLFPAVGGTVGAGVSGYIIILLRVHLQVAAAGAADANDFFDAAHFAITSSTATVSGPSAFSSRTFGRAMCSISPGAMRWRLNLASCLPPQVTVIWLGP